MAEHDLQTETPAHGHCRFEWFSAFTIQRSAEAPVQSGGRVGLGQFILTYRKGKGRLLDRRGCERRRTEPDGCWESDELRDQPARFLNGRIRLRQITRLCKGGHQTRIITGRRELRDIEVDCRMFDWWRWQKPFGHVRAQFPLAALQRTPVDVIVADVRMPKRSGIDAVRLLRGRGDFTPVVLVSTFDDPTLLV